jgi:ribonuclease-3
VIAFELISQTLDEFNSPVFETEILIEGIPACKGKGYSKKESQQIAAHETLNKIKKDSAFLERIFAEKALREAPEEAVEIVDSKSIEVLAIEEDSALRSDNIEEIISAAEEAAYATE